MGSRQITDLKLKIQMLEDTKDAKILARIIQKFPETLETYDKLLEELTLEINTYREKTKEKHYKVKKGEALRVLEAYNVIERLALPRDTEVTDDMISKVYAFFSRILADLKIAPYTKRITRRYCNLFIIEVVGHTYYSEVVNKNVYFARKYFLTEEGSDKYVEFKRLKEFIGDNWGVIQTITPETRIEDIYLKMKGNE